MAAALPEEQIEGLVQRAVDGDRAAAHELFGALWRDHLSHDDRIARTLARLDHPAFWELLLPFMAGEGWQGQHLPIREFGLVHDLQRLFIQPYGQPLARRQAAVRTALEARSSHLRATAATVAAKQRSRAALPALEELLRDPYPEVRIAAAHALAAMPDADAIDALLSNMGERDFGVRLSAAEALRAVGRPALPVLLHHLIEHRLSPAFREAAVHALPQLTLGADTADVNALLNALRGTASGVAVPVAADKLLCWYEDQARAPAR